MSKHEDEVCKKIQQRAKVGKAKYGVTMERTDLNIVEWLIQDYKKFTSSNEILNLLKELNE